jgi:hypothetical protein
MLERNVANEPNPEGFKYRCAELYEKGWVHIVWSGSDGSVSDQNKERNIERSPNGSPSATPRYDIIGKVPVWNVLRTMSPRKLYKWIHDKHKTYKLSRILHQLQPSTDNIKEAFTVTDIRQTNGVTLRSLL